MTESPAQSPAPPSHADGERSGKARRVIALTALGLILVPVVVFSLWVWATLGYVYASGERAGFVQKISKKGWLCKTWEGELAMANLPGTMPEIFKFTVRNDSIAALIEKSAGKRVSLTYQQHRGVPTACFGDTQYFITGIRPVAQ